MTGKPYDFGKPDLEMLLGAVGLPADVRRDVLAAHFAKRHKEGAVEVLNQFISLAARVVENNREMIELFLITEGDMHPHTAEKINLPTLFGALNGLILAEGIDQSRVCKGCAYRVGTPANTSPVTTCDADWQQKQDDMFWCHEHITIEGKPTRKCTGFLQHRKHRGQ